MLSLYKQNIDPRLFVNELYVAFTRASERLVLIHNESNIPLQFLDERVVRNLTTYIDSITDGRRIRIKKNKLIKTAVTDITRHIKDEVMVGVNISESTKTEMLIAISKCDPNNNELECASNSQI